MSGVYVSPHRSLPLGVAVLAFVIGIVAFLILLAGIFIVVLHIAGYGLDSFRFFGPSLLGGGLLILFAILLFVVASGLWHLELWALVLSIIVIGVLWISDVVAGQLFSLGAVVLLLVLVYLALVRRHFS